MGFGRHRQTPEKIQEVVQQKITEHKEKFAQKVAEQKKETVIEKKPTPVVKEIKFTPRSRGIIKEVPEPSKKIIAPVAKENIEAYKKPAKKKREDKKAVNALGLIGSTVVATDFRAIVKKKNLQINVVLTQILHDWNMANYNL